MNKAPTNQLVRYSRAGDSFHYRWAARQCLRLIHPQSNIERFTIEGSLEANAAGEYVIDLAEYRHATVGRSVTYFQLKHSTKRLKRPFARSELDATLKGFSARYAALLRAGTKGIDINATTFVIVTNRAIGASLKTAISENAASRKAGGDYQTYLERVTKLRGKRLRDFCASLLFQDEEGDYAVQKTQLRSELAAYTAGVGDNGQVQALISLVEDRALPRSEDGRINNEIYKEDVLQRLGVTSERDLFPAPSLLEMPEAPVVREQQKDLFAKIWSATGPMIVHAAGGVGKSVVAQQLLAAIPNGSRGFVYDCFGGGKYRNPSEPRHRAQHALVQLANEIAVAGLCAPIIGRVEQTDLLFREFLARLSQATGILRAADKDARLLIVVDAADNAEIAADEYGDKCFAHLLLREDLPDKCRLVMFCRSERTALLRARSTVTAYELLPFSLPETTCCLRLHYANASDSDCLEFHRLTGGNPRVQANAFSNTHSMSELLSRLNPAHNTVDGQIASRLADAVNAIKEHVERSQVDAICRGLANLPPFVPLNVLAQVANVSIGTVRSFINDLGRPLWLTDESVQFRDEPTETWFRKTFSADKGQVIGFVNALEPLAMTYPYVAKVLPQLLLRAGVYQRLVDLALSDKSLPENSAIDKRDIRLYRLQFAFRAAIRLGRMADATRLALRAGEEAAGSDRQIALLQSNIDLIALCQGSQRVQELAYRRIFSSAWDGSSNVFSGALLSSVKDFHGEARSYLRASENWLQIHFAERAKRAAKKDALPVSGEQLQDTDIVELSWARLNVLGPVECAKYVMAWRPGEVVFRVARLLIRRLVDAGQFGDIEQIAQVGAKNVYMMMAVADELLAVGRFPPKQSLRVSLGMLAAKKTRIPKVKPFAYEDHITPAIESLAEASATQGLSRRQILSVLNHYVPMVADRSFSGPGQRNSRRILFRGIALREILNGHISVQPSVVLPRARPKATVKPDREIGDRDRQDILEITGALLPWYVVRARALVASTQPLAQELEEAERLSERALRFRYRQSDSLPWEISCICSDIVVLATRVAIPDAQPFCEKLLAAEKFAITDRLDLARAAFRSDKLALLRTSLELSCRDAIDGFNGESPEEHANWLTLLARAVLPASTPDAAAYFDQAIDAMSKFGDEHVERWEAVVALARRTAQVGGSPPETVYRFVRCAELIGETVVREKYWDRDDVFRVAVRLDAPSAFAALSRWRDRRIGRFNEQLKALAIEAVKSKLLAPSVGWCLSGFVGCNASTSFAAVCVENETHKSVQQRIIDAAVRDQEMAGSWIDRFMKLKIIARKAGLSTNSIDDAARMCASDSDAQKLAAAAPCDADMAAPIDQTKDPRQWFDGVNILTSDGIDQCYRRFKEKDGPRNFQVFWQEVFRRVPQGQEAAFQHAAIGAISLDRYDFANVVSQMRSEWLMKAAVKSKWNGFLRDIGRKLAIDLLQNRGSFAYFCEGSHLDDLEREIVEGAVIDGLSESSELINASAFFNFVRHVAGRLNDDEAPELLSYAMSRFEQHIEEGYADGNWADWLSPPRECSEAVAGLIWSSLGSPIASIRWEAAHAVRRLAAHGCMSEISHLVKRLSTQNGSAFNSDKLPFYDLHAKLYLLIALARVAKDDTATVKPHVHLFETIATEGSLHILMQKFAAQIALMIHNAEPEVCAADSVERLSQVGRSPFPIKRTKDYRYQVNTLWQTIQNVDTTLSLHLDFDFDHYWLRPLGDVFGVSETEVTELSRDIAVKSIGIPESNDDVKDPRQAQWEESGGRRGPYDTWHDHGSYPMADSYQFYYSYHALLATASRMLAATPVVSRYQNQSDSPWEDWLARHALTRSDGRWLADRRDPTPHLGDGWARNEEHQDWEWRVQAADFISKLREGRPWAKSICVSGQWTDAEGPRVEDVSVTSALVKNENVEAVVTAIRGLDESSWTALPSYGDDGSLEASETLKATGWILRSEKQDKRIDGFDPYARDIRMPPAEIGPKYAKMLQLAPDADRRKWRLPGRDEVSLQSMIWSEEHRGPEDDPLRSGERLWADLNLLTHLCRKTRKSLVFEVRIKRRVNARYSSHKDDDYGYVHPSRKIFVLSADGELRDKHEQYHSV